jgi:hypothetical protein
MPKFKHRRNGQIIDVSENHANQVIRKKAVYEEIGEEECQSKSAPETENKATSGATKASATQAKTPSKKQPNKAKQSKPRSQSVNSKAT